MVCQLLVVAGPDQGRVFPLTDGQNLVVGRGQTTETRLKDPQVSRTHCQVQVDGGKVLLTDSGSMAGTMVNGKRVVGKIELRPGDLIQVGGTQLRLQLEGSHEASTLVTPPAAQKATPEKVERLTELVGKSLSHYQVGPIIAKGQSGVIFKAEDTKAGQTVALKVLWPEFSKNDEEMQRFIRAMKTVLPLRHENLITLYAAGKTAPHYCWMAMEYVDGESVTQVIQRIGVAGMLDWRNALRVAMHIARALDYAHGNNIIHRNITPTNILIRSSDKVTKLGDLMLAKALEGTMAQQVTRPGELVGDVSYMSPERTRGGADIDARSDIYSLGATVYALLTGRPPHEGGSLPEIITKIRSAEPVKPKKYQLSIPDLFEGTVLQMLAKRPEERFQSAAELVNQLERVAKFQGVTL
jgi:serine/threonine protein kinase